VKSSPSIYIIRMQFQVSCSLNIAKGHWRPKRCHHLAFAEESQRFLHFRPSAISKMAFQLTSYFFLLICSVKSYFSVSSWYNQSHSSLALSLCVYREKKMGETHCIIYFYGFHISSNEAFYILFNRVHISSCKHFPSSESYTPFSRSHFSHLLT